MYALKLKLLWPSGLVTLLRLLVCLVELLRTWMLSVPRRLYHSFEIYHLRMLKESYREIYLPVCAITSSMCLLWLSSESLTRSAILKNPSVLMN